MANQPLRGSDAIASISFTAVVQPIIGDVGDPLTYYDGEIRCYVGDPQDNEDAEVAGHFSVPPCETGRRFAKQTVTNQHRGIGSAFTPRDWPGIVMKLVGARMTANSRVVG